MRWLLVSFLSGLSSLAFADVVVPTFNIGAGTILEADHVRLEPKSFAGTIATLDQAIGQEARVVLYAGRPIKIGDLTEPATVHRNQLVPLVFEVSGLRISTDGRALDRGSVGDRIRVMNINSRKTLFGQIQEDGSIAVSR